MQQENLVLKFPLAYTLTVTHSAQGNADLNSLGWQLSKKAKDYISGLWNSD